MAAGNDFAVQGIRGDVFVRTGDLRAGQRKANQECSNTHD
jgi:hypothetical protein